jgi:hypothetical protein
VLGEIGNFLRLVPFKMFTEIGQAIFYLSKITTSPDA